MQGAADPVVGPPDRPVLKDTRCGGVARKSALFYRPIDAVKGTLSGNERLAAGHRI